jgi:uncharacterized membrane protein YfcA
MIPLGILLALLGIWTMWQARLPRDKRRVRARGSSRRILSARECLLFGGTFGIGGTCAALHGAGIPITTPVALVAVAIFAVIVTASIHLAE